MMSIFLLLMGLFINAPLEELANGNVTPAVAKAPWYFLGLQELLAYFHPTVAGVLVADLRARRGRRSSRTSTAATSWPRPAVRAQDRGHAVHAVLRPRPDRDLRRHLLPRPRLHLRHPVRDQPTASTSPCDTRPEGSSAHEQLPGRAGRPAAGPRPRRRSSRCATQQVQGHLAAPAPARLASAAAIGLWLLEVTAGTIGFLWPNLTGGFGGKVKIGDLDDVKLAEHARCRSTRASRPTSRRRAPSSILDRPGPAAVRRRRGHDRRRHRAQRPGALPALPAPRLQAEPVPQELLVRVPLPRLALRPARASRPPAPQYGPAPRSMDRFSATVDGDGRPDARHRQDHARPAAGRARPAGHHPAAHPDGLHLMTDETPTTPPTEPDEPTSPAGEPEERLPATGPPPSRRRSSASRAARRSAHRSSLTPERAGRDRPPVRERPLGRLPGGRSSSACSSSSTGSTSSARRSGSSTPRLAAEAAAQQVTRSSAATTCSRPTAPAATAPNGQGDRATRDAGYSASTERQDEAVRPPQRGTTSATC